MQNFSEKLFDHLQEHPERTIFHFQKTGSPDLHFTYKELLIKSSYYAQKLISKNINPGEVAVIILKHSPDLIFSYFGCILAGVIPSIMPFLTEKLRPEKYRGDLKSLIEITQPAAVISYGEFHKEILSMEGSEKLTRQILLCESINKKGPISINKEDYPGINRKPGDVVLLQHSSGTTGLQKGVALSHRAVFNQIDSYSRTIHLNENDMIVSWLPLYHDMGLIASFLMPILFGTPLVLMSPFDWVRAPHKLFQSISTYRGTLTWLPNFAYNFCAQKIRPDDLKEIDLTSLRNVINCSEPMRYESHKLFGDRFKPYGFKENAFATSYAMAENVFAVTQGGIDSRLKYETINLEKLQFEKIAVEAKLEERSVIMVSAGKTIPNTSIRIVDENWVTLEERKVGEIMVQGNCMLTGYYNREDETKKSIIDGWFATGDFGYIAEGELYITGRKKDLIIIGGKNIYPQDIEETTSGISGIHPGRSVAFGIFNQKKGTEDVVVIAEIDPKFKGTKEDLKREIRSTVSQNTAIALRTVYLVPPKWLIKTSSGKIARSANKEKYLSEISTK